VGYVVGSVDVVVVIFVCREPLIVSPEKAIAASSGEGRIRNVSDSLVERKNE
jgi:hypothetical protein